MNSQGEPSANEIRDTGVNPPDLIVPGEDIAKKPHQFSLNIPFFVFFLIATVAGIAIYMFMGFPKSTGIPVIPNYNLPNSPTPEQGTPITTKGTIACLPGKNVSGATTLECAIGLKALDGNYYGLSFLNQEDLVTKTATGNVVAITGTLTHPAADKYLIKGVIDVTSMTILEKSKSPLPK